MLHKVPPWVKKFFFIKDKIPTVKLNCSKEYFKNEILDCNKDFVEETKLALNRPENTQTKVSFGSDLNSYYLRKRIMSKSIKEKKKNDEKKNSDEIDENIEKIYQIVSESFELINKDHIKLKRKKEILIEWKEIARRLGTFNLSFKIVFYSIN